MLETQECHNRVVCQDLAVISIVVTVLRLAGRKS